MGVVEWLGRRAGALIATDASVVDAASRPRRKGRTRFAMLRFFILASALTACASTPAEPVHPFTTNADIRWMQTFSSAGDDWINDIIPLRNGNWLAVGFLNRGGGSFGSDWRALAAEVNARGAVIRQNEYGDGGGADAFWAAVEDARGNIVHVGFTGRIGAGGLDAFVLRSDARGVILSEGAYGDADYDRVTDLAPTPNGGWIMSGHSIEPGSPHRRVMILKVDAESREVWRRIFVERESSGALYIEPLPDGGYVVSGGASQGDDGDLLLLKLDADGREIWRRRIGAEGTSDVNHGLVVRPDGRIVAVGYTASWGAESYDLFAVTVSPDGELLQRSVFGGAGDDRPILADINRDGRVWLVGYTRSVGAGDWDVIVAALDERGVFEPGAAILATPQDDNGTAIAAMPNGDLLVAGYSAAFGGGAQDAFLLRMRQPDLGHADPRFTRR